MPDPAVMPPPELVALGHLARLGLEWCPPELRGRTQMLMRGELPEGDARRTVNDLDRVLRGFERNPNELIFGAKPALPEFHGGP